jgi:hypothetical protein
MNAERLNAVAQALRGEIAGTALLDRLASIANALNNLGSDPANASQQMAVAKARGQLDIAVRASRIPELSPMWRQIVDEIGGTPFVGPAVAEQVTAIVSTNQITPAVAAREVQLLRQRVEAFSASLDQLIAALTTLKIGAENLAPGECEIGVLVPRAFVDNRLDKFADELEEIDQIIGVFEELCTGSRPSPTIRTISSSDLSVYMDLAPVVGAAVAHAVNQIVDVYKKLLEIRKLKGELAKQGVEPKALKGIDDHANKTMEEGIGGIFKDLMAQYSDGGKKERNNEIEIELKFALKRIANRVDRGFNFEVRMSEPPASADNEVAEEDATRAAFARIQDATANLQYLRADGEPVLSLTEKEKPSAAKS